MQTIRIDVKDMYVHNILDILNSLQDIMIDKIKLDSIKNINYIKTEDSFSLLQTSSMKKTWDNREDEAWDEL